MQRVVQGRRGFMVDVGPSQSHMMGRWACVRRGWGGCLGGGVGAWVEGWPERTSSARACVAELHNMD